jgi:hypothetical protein
VDIKYRLIFRGFKKDTAQDEVWENVGKLFNLPIENVRAIFSALGRTVKSGVTLDDAVRYQKAIDTAGVICVVEPDKQHAHSADIPPQHQELRSSATPQDLHQSASADFHGTERKESSSAALGSEQDTVGAAHLTDNNATSTTRQTKQCETCAKTISVLADKCPTCGAPNDWIHPDIKSLISRKNTIGVSKPFTLQWNKTEVWGETKLKVPWWAWLIFALTAPFSAFGSIVVGLLISALCAAVLLPLVGKKQTFKANLQTGAWESSDDKFWQSVRSALRISKVGDELSIKKDKIPAEEDKSNVTTGTTINSMLRPRRHR